MAGNVNKNPWLAGGAARSQSAALRLFCFPYAGGGASAFRTWGAALAPEAAVYPVQLPGREMRLRERPFTSLPLLVRAAADALAPHLAEPFALYGHSMGSLIAFELARLLRRERGTTPAALFVSGGPAPQLAEPKERTYELPEPEFLDRLRRLGGTPPAVLEHPELMQLMSPLLRADFELVETYAYEPGEPPLSCPVFAYGGLSDPEATREEIEGWREQTTAPFSLRMLPGDHFFINSDAARFLAAFARDVKALARGGV